MRSVVVLADHTASMAVGTVCASPVTLSATQSPPRRSAGRKRYRLRRLYPHKAPRPAGQLPLLPELNRPVTRLRDFGGGRIPPAVAVEIEFRRKQRGLTQREVAASIGRSQGQLANALRGHDPISAATVNRLRELLLGVPLRPAVA